MFFNSIEFAIFLPAVFILYWFVTNKSLKAQNLLLVAASYFFYGWWDWRFLGLIFISSVVDYLIGIKLFETNNDKQRKFLLGISIGLNIGLLGFFKYFNFFVDSFVEAFSLFGVSLNVNSLNIILPVGISFYTFQTLSYSIDIYRRKFEPTRDAISFLAFVSFFPQLVAGPIERASNLLPQFYTKRVFNYANAIDGLRQILWGFVKKVVIADSCALYVDLIFEDPASQSGSTLLVGAFLFAFQIYGDFSGYSDITIGISRLFGFELKQNFAFPFFSRDISEYWRRWHISLSTWFRDYLYIPLGGSRVGMLKKIRNVFIIFVISGFWHGANWTFIAWGALSALFFIPLFITNRNRKHIDIVAKGKIFPSFRSIMQMFYTFWLTTLLLVFIRAEHVSHGFNYLVGIFSESLFTVPTVRPKSVFILIFIFTLIEWFGREGKHGLEKVFLNWKRPFRILAYYVLVFSIYYYAYENKQQVFIYFQF